MMRKLTPGHPTAVWNMAYQLRCRTMKSRIALLLTMIAAVPAVLAPVAVADPIPHISQYCTWIPDGDGHAEWHCFRIP